MAFDSLSDKLAGVFKRLRSRGKLSESDVKTAMREVRLALLEADVNYKVAKDFTNAVTEKCIGENVMESLTAPQMVIKIVKEELTALMGSEQARLNTSSKLPTVIMMCGLQGSGKTTHSAKLAKFLRAQGHRPMLAACDIDRPAAIEQLKVVGKAVQAPVFEMGTEKPEIIAKKAVAYARDYGHDYLILDTAGRLHIDTELMDELKRITEAIDVHNILLVIDSMVGQDAVNIAKSFNEILELDGVILTKLDGDTRGGAALSVRYITGKPIKFIGVGEKLDQIEPFHPDRMARRILGMGDVLTLIDKAQAQFDEKKAAELEEKLRQQIFTLDDYLEQMAQLKNMGGLEQIAAMMPGMKPGALKDAKLDKKMLIHQEAIIKSMTRYEREHPECLNASRKQRVAKGSGTSVEEINKLLKSYEQIKKMMKQFSDMGRTKQGRRQMSKMKFPF